MSKDFPRMVFRDGSALPEHGIDWLIVADEAEQRAALADGWRLGLHPLDHDGDGKPGGSLPDAVAPRKRGRPRKGAQ
jgi:hypothetical protein